ncbi:MAG: hypothetical protein AAB874_02225 [Patescibacteria group bacterium]
MIWKRYGPDVIADLMEAGFIHYPSENVVEFARQQAIDDGWRQE